MSFERRHDEGSSGVARLHVDESVSGYARQMAAAVPAHQYSMWASGRRGRDWSAAGPDRRGELLATARERQKGESMGNRTRTSWNGCLLLVRTVAQTRVARGGLQHRSRWYDATRGRRGCKGSDDSRLVCLTCCLLVARATFRVAALAEAKLVAVAVTTVERRLAHCKKPSAAFLSREGRRRRR